MDVFWFRIPKHRGEENDTTGIFTAGRIMALIDRGEYWQCAYVFEKGQADEVRACGLSAVRSVQFFQNAAQKRIVGRLLARQAGL